MKKLFFISIVTVLTAMFFSCNNDNDSIVGNWQFSSFDFDVVADNPEHTLQARQILNNWRLAIDDIQLSFDNNGEFSEIRTTTGQRHTRGGRYNLNDGVLRKNGQIVPHSLSNNRLTIHHTPNEFGLGSITFTRFIVTTTYIRR